MKRSGITGEICFLVFVGVTRRCVVFGNAYGNGVQAFAAAEAFLFVVAGFLWRSRNNISRRKPPAGD